MLFAVNDKNFTKSTRFEGQWFEGQWFNNQSGTLILL